MAKSNQPCSVPTILYRRGDLAVHATVRSKLSGEPVYLRRVRRRCIRAVK